MTWDAISAIAEVVGAIAVVASLSFVGRQFFQNTDAIRTSTAQSHTDAYLSVTARITQDKDFASVWLTGLSDPELLDDVDRARFIGFLSTLFRYYETSYILYRKGKLDQEFRDTLEIQISEGAATPGFAEWWSLRSHWFSENFRQLVEDKRAKNAEPLRYRSATKASTT